MYNYLFDGSFEGLLTAVYDYFALRHQQAILQTDATFHTELFTPTHRVITNEANAERVWEGLQKKVGRSKSYGLFTVYLSEDPIAHRHLFNYIVLVFQKGAEVTFDYRNDDVLQVENFAKKVNRERHRMKAFVRFSSTPTGLYTAVVEPDFNVLPLIKDHFQNRYADQPWLIFDVKRHYGLYYDLEKVDTVMPSNPSNHSDINVDELFNDDDYTTYWKTYFKNTNISARKNLKLHLQHVPPRYWKYLPEKADSL